MKADITYTNAGDHIELSKEEFGELKATMETLEDQEVLDQLAESEEAKKEGRVREWGEVKKEISA